MAEMFLHGSSFKDFDPTPNKYYKKAVEANQSYDWEEIDYNDLSDDGFPKRFRCKQTEIEVIQIHAKDPVKFFDGELLSTTLEEQLLSISNIDTQKKDKNNG